MKISLAILLLVPTLGAGANRPDVKPRPHQPPLVRLLEPGAAPLLPLRYALKGSQDVTVVARGDLTVKRPNESKVFPFPTMTTPVTLTPSKGKVEFVWRKGSFESPDNSSATSVIGHMITALEGSTGTLLTDTQGVISQIFLKAGPTDKAAAGMMENRTIYAMEMGKGILSLLEVPLPAESIGVGGRWQVERIATRGALSIVQFTTFTLLKRTGNLLELSYRFGGKFDPGSGMRENEVALAVSGGGKCTLDLTRPMPPTLEDEIVVYARITASDGLYSEQSTRVGTRIESK